MNKNFSKLMAGSVLLVAPLLTSTAFAGDGHCAYVYDRSGAHVTHRTGECVITSTWSKEQATEQCHADLIMKPVAAAPMAPPPPPPPPAPAPQPMYKIVTLSASALFDFDKTIVKPEGRHQLDDLAGQLNSMQNVKNIMIIGHTDSIGSESYNQNLSVRRAVAVKNHLQGRGVSDNLMSTSGMGESQPVASNATRAGRAQNRRVEVIIKGKKLLPQ